MQTYVILLRGVMPTGKNRVPMAELRVALADAGLAEVRTYIQSGNVIARSGLDPARVGRLVHEAIRRRMGADITVVTRTPAQVLRILALNPFPHADPARLYFTLLASPAAPALARGLLEIDFAPDEVKVVGDTIYTLYASKLSDSRYDNNYFERRLKVAATTRNFNTLSRLAELGAEPAG